MLKVMFSKMLQPLGSMEKAADVIADLGFDGVDLTVREKGHIEPQDAAKMLPEAVKIFEKRNLKIGMITTNITDISSPCAEEIIKTAADCGIKYLKLGYWRYDGFGTIKAAIADAKKALTGLEPLFRKYNVTAGVHIHSGKFLTADGAVVWEIIRDFHPDYIAAYIDAGHMALEGTQAVWMMSMDILSDRIAMCAIKDLAVLPADDPKKKWTRSVMPLGEGFVPWKEFFDCLKQTGFDGVLTLHSEYHMEVDQIIEQTRKDLELVNSYI